MMARGFRVAQLGPWSISRDWNLRATQDGETYLPFRYHVRSGHDEACSAPNGDDFQIFLRLPVELQQHVVLCCNQATLFKLMHTSSFLRKEAKRLFWSDPTSRYAIDGKWLFAGGQACHTNFDVEALTHMQYIEVSFDSDTSYFIFDWREDECFSDTHEGTEMRALFWTTLHRRFPRVRDVVLNERSAGRDGEPPPETMIRLATTCPAGISVSVSQLRRFGEWYAPETRHLWHRDCTPSTWDLVTSSWNPQRITPPTRRFSGPVGEYEQYNYDLQDIAELRFAREIHAMHSTAAYYSHVVRSPCICPWPTCGLTFEKPEDWMAHYLKGCLRGSEHERPVPLPPSEEVRAAFAAHDTMLERKGSELAILRMELQADFHDDMANERFLQQLRDDPVYANGGDPKESDVWRSYHSDMNSIAGGMIFD